MCYHRVQTRTNYIAAAASDPNDLFSGLLGIRAVVGGENRVLTMRMHSERAR